MTDRERIEQLEMQVYHLVQIVQVLLAGQPCLTQWLKSTSRDGRDYSVFALYEPEPRPFEVGVAEKTQPTA
jgi:hypothetical protein